MLNLMVLHWGTVELTIEVSGAPASGVISPKIDSGVIKPLSGRGSTKILVGRGKTNTLKGN
tara:strand:+ start:26735 stop:26917 length:183 start_codon:yes stop_codon:yes gene_type:complete